MLLYEDPMFPIHDDYVRTLVERIKERREEWRKRNFGSSKSQFLRDFCTVGIHSPRQSFAYGWFEERFVRTPESILIVRDERFKKTFYSNVEALHPGTTFFVYTFEEYIEGIRNQTLRPKAGATFIEDSTTFFTRVRIKKFYSWLANHVGDDHLIYRLN